MKKSLILVLVSVLLGAPVAAVAGRPDADAGREAAKTVCAPCHGPAGISLVRNYPNLAGQKENYLISSMEAYRTGERKSPDEMSPVAEKLTDQDIKNLAAYFSGLSPCGDACAASN